MIGRRRVLAAGVAAILASPLLAQQQKVWRIGLLMGRSRPANLETDFYGAFPRGMRALGYVEGKNVRYEWRFADGKLAPLPRLADELVRLDVDVIVTSGTAAPRAAQRATATIPIVMAGVSDPIGQGFVKSLARPGGNITGITNLSVDMSPKQLELLTRTVPKASKIALLRNPGSPASEGAFESLRTATRGTGVELTAVDARTSEEMARAFSAMSQQGAQALIVAADPYFIIQRRLIAELAAKARLPAIYSLREHAQAGGLMSYGSSRATIFERAATFVDKILKGAKPTDLPIEQPTKFELIINLKAAKALGLRFPREVMTLADEVIR